MQCAFCDTVNDDDANFCKQCGVELQKHRPSALVYSIFSQWNGSSTALPFHVVSGQQFNELDEAVAWVNANATSGDLLFYVGAHRPDETPVESIQVEHLYILIDHGDRFSRGEDRVDAHQGLLTISITNQEGV